jgi:hypothetical protein
MLMETCPRRPKGLGMTRDGSNVYAVIMDVDEAKGQIERANGKRADAKAATKAVDVDPKSDANRDASDDS